METIFYVLFESAGSKSDRTELFKGEKTLQDYMNWQYKQKKELESTNGPCIVINMNIIYK